MQARVSTHIDSQACLTRALGKKTYTGYDVTEITR